MVWDVGLSLPLLISDSTYVYIYGNGPIGMVDAQGSAYYYLRDGLGSVTGIVDSSGTLTATYSYDAYGNLRSSTGTIANAFRYTGEWYDSYIKLYQVGARWYDQDLGRFLSPDTIVPDYSNPQSLNRYAYAFNNPLTYVDPSGHDPLDAEWEAEYRRAHGLKDTDSIPDAAKLDRLASYLSSSISGKAWTDADWQSYSVAKQSGLFDPNSVLAGTSGSTCERIKLASGLITLAASGREGMKIYESFVKGGGTVQFGGGDFIRTPWGAIGRNDGYSIGWDNTIYLEPNLQTYDAEIIGANIAHEAYHAQRGVPRCPFSRTEEMHAFAQEARAWEGLRVTYKGSTWTEAERLVNAYYAGQLDRYVESADPVYTSWIYWP